MIKYQDIDLDILNTRIDHGIFFALATDHSLGNFGKFYLITAPLDDVLTTEEKINEKNLEPAETSEDIEKRARKPPADGPCKRCGQDRPLNRLMLCYRCWVIANLIEKGGGNWIPGDPHPETCHCTLPEHTRDIPNGGSQPANN